MWKKGFYGVLILMLLFTMLMQGNSKIYAVSSVIRVDNPEALPTGVLYQDNQITIGPEADGSRLVLQGSTTTNTISIASGVTNLTLILNGVSITSSEQSPIQLLGAGNIVIELADGTRNLLDAQLTSSKAALRTGNSGILTINGTSGTLDVLGGLNGAGIGGGLSNSAGNININGGTVTAIGNGNSAGIGYGENGQLNNIQIGELATVLAQSSNVESIGANGQSSAQLVKGKLSVVLNESQKTYLKAGSVVMPFESNYNYFAVSGVEATQIEVYADEACTTKLYDIGTLLGDRLIPVSDTIDANSTEVDYAPRMVKNNKIILTSSNPMIVTKELLEAKDVFVEDGNLIYKVLDAPKHGQLERVSAAGVAITQFSQQDLTDKQVCYVYDGNKGTSDSFNFSLYDGTTESAVYTANKRKLCI